MECLTYGLMAHIDGICESVITQQKPDIVLPSHLIRDLNKIREDLISHAEATLTGRLNQEQNDKIKFVLRNQVLERWLIKA